MTNGENKRKKGIMRKTLLSLKMGHKEGQLYSFTALVFNNTKDLVHSPVLHCSAVIYFKILSPQTHTSYSKMNLLLSRFLSHTSGRVIIEAL